MRADPDRSDSPDAVDFLTALLMSYPEVGSARLCDNGTTLILEFFLAQRLETARLREFAKDFREALSALAWLKRLEHRLVKLQRGGAPPHSGSSDNYASVESFEATSEEYERADSLQILRDTGSVTMEELALTVELVVEEFERDLVIGDEFEEDDEGYQDMLEHSLDRVRYLNLDNDLVGFRDDLRVLVYATDDDAPRRR